MHRLLYQASALVLAASRAYAQLRFPCSQLVTERLDPLVTPGQVSPHLHQIVGGNAFNITMDPRIDIAETSTCTTCRFVEDKSNYWTAVMYFRHPNGSFIRVPQMANHNTGPGYQDGGMTVYYFQPRPPTKDLNVVAFAKGFRMRVGRPMARTNDLDPKSTEATVMSFRCFEGADPGLGVPGSGPTDTYEFPPRPCSGGIRSNIYFPQCWDGVSLDSHDHESHVAHPVGGIFGTDCPSTHPVRVPLLFMEIVWDTRPFNDMWPTDGSQPFVFSMGDPTGYGQHADYVFGWEGDSLQRAMDVCFGGEGIPTNCPALKVQDMDAMNACKQAAKVPEVTEGQYIEKLPGCNPLQGGPEPATAIPNCDAPSTTTAAPVPTEPPSLILPPWSVCNPGTVHEIGVPFCNSIPKTTTAGPVPTPPPTIVTPL